jgi:hypothetical protein
MFLQSRLQLEIIVLRISDRDSVSGKTLMCFAVAGLGKRAPF